MFIIAQFGDHPVDAPYIQYSYMPNFEVYLDLANEVLGAPGTPSSPTTSTTKEHVKEFGRRVATASAIAATLLNSLLAKLVVGLPRFGVGQHLVGHRYLLEFLTGAGILIRVVLEGQLPVCLLEFAI